MGRGGGQVVSVLAFYTDDPSQNPADADSFFSVECVLEKTENKQKEAGVVLVFIHKKSKNFDVLFSCFQGSDLHTLLFPYFLYPAQSVAMSGSIFMTVGIAPWGHSIGSNLSWGSLT